MTAMVKRTGYVPLIVAAIFSPLCILAIFFSCERFDYERVIIIETGSVTEISANSAEMKGQIIDLGESEVTQHGHCWSKNKEPNKDSDDKVNHGPRTTRGSFSTTLTNLDPGTKYYIRAYATNAQGTVYGREESLVTLPVSGSAPVADFSSDYTVIPEGEFVQFYDLSTNVPTSWEWDFGDGQTSVEQDPLHLYEDIGNYTVSLTVSNAFGSDNETKQDYIIVAALHISPVAEFTADTTTISAGGSVQFFDLSEYTPTEWYWDFGDGGSSTEQDPLYNYETVGVYTVSLIATNSYGSDTMIKEDYITVGENTTETGTFVDERDDRIYKWVKIGEQIWMAENLAFLPEVFPPGDYSSTDPVNYVYGYTLYDTAEAKALLHYKTYGALYNWASAVQYCPGGWHLPSESEWQILISFLDGESVAGGKLKEAGFEHWLDPNTGADNSSGYTALPGGTYFSETSDNFYGVGNVGYWWSSTEIMVDTVRIWGLYHDDNLTHRARDAKHNGNSIRCVQDGGSRKMQLPATDDDPAVSKRRKSSYP